VFVGGKFFSLVCYLLVNPSLLWGHDFMGKIMGLPIKVILIITIVADASAK